IHTEAYSILGTNYHSQPEIQVQNTNDVAHQNKRVPLRKHKATKSKPHSDARSTVGNIASDTYVSKPTIAPTAFANQKGRTNNTHYNKGHNKNTQIKVENGTLHTVHDHKLAAIILTESQNTNELSSDKNSQSLQIKNLFLQDNEDIKQNAKDMVCHVKNCDHLNCDLTSLQEKLTSIVHTVDQCKIIIAFFLLLVTLLLFNPILFFILVLILSLFIGFLTYEYYQCQHKLQSTNESC
ncbi:MAG: hypothetical protein ACRCS6_10405, partial [Turicibacter sp.]